MNWEVLGILADIVSAAAVLVTLIYIAMQTRLTRLAVEDSAKHATQQATNSAVEAYSRWRNMTLTGLEVPETLAKIRSDEKLSEKERIAARAYFEELFYASAAVYRSGQSAASDHVASTTAAHLLFVIRQYPLAVEFWIETKPYIGNVSSEFVQEVDVLLTRANGEDQDTIGGAPADKSMAADV